MSLWNLIRDFIVQHITGGLDSSENFYSANIGWVGNANEDYYEFNDINSSIGFTGSDNKLFMGYSDWLATTLTIISLIFILVACVMFVVKMVKLVGNLVK